MFLHTIVSTKKRLMPEACEMSISWRISTNNSVAVEKRQLTEGATRTIDLLFEFQPIIKTDQDNQDRG